MALVPLVDAPLVDEPLVDAPELLHWSHGARAMSAASLLARDGRREVAVPAGGPHELTPAGHDLEVLA